MKDFRLWNLDARARRAPRTRGTALARVQSGWNRGQVTRPTGGQSSARGTGRGSGAHRAGNSATGRGQWSGHRGQGRQAAYRTERIASHEKR